MIRTLLNVTLGVLTAIVAVALWLFFASALWCKGTGSPFAAPWLQWWDALAWWGANWWVNLWLVLAASVPTIFLAMLGFGLFLTLRWRWHGGRRLARLPGGGVRSVERGVTDNHGHARWRSMADALKLFPGPDARHGGVVVGEAYRVDQDRVAKRRFVPRDQSTWGRGGTAPLLIDPCTAGSGHSIVFAGPGGYKTTSAVSTILEWIGSSVILDPSTELGPMLDGAMRAQGKTVVHIGISGGDDTMPPATGFNVLAWIDIDDPEAEIHVRTVVSWIYESATPHAAGHAEDPFFAPMGRELVTCLLAHLLWSDDATVEKSLASLAAGISVPEDAMLDLLAGINATSNSQMARRIAGTLMRCKAEETFSGVFMNAVKGIAWLFTSAYADIVSAGEFDPRTLLTDRTTAFLNLSLRTLQVTPAIARVLVGALLNTVYMADGKTNGRILFLLDEAATLGRLKALETARDTGRKYGVSLHLLMQSVGQMTEAWGRDGTRAWTDAANWIGYAAIRAAGAGKELSDALGSHGVLAYSEGDNQGRQKPFGLNFGSTSRGINLNVHEIRRTLMAASEMQQDLRDDEIIIVPANGLPIRCGRAIYFRRPEMMRQVAANRFVRSAAAG